MDAVEYLKAANRMCDEHFCNDCPLGDLEYQCPVRITSAESEIMDKVVEIVEQWAKDHPVKTRQSEFLKMFPNAKRGIDGILCIDPCKIDITCEEVCEISKNDCDECKRAYWLTEVSE